VDRYHPFPRPQGILASTVGLILANPGLMIRPDVERDTTPDGDPVFRLSTPSGDLGAIVVSARDEMSSVLWFQAPSASTDRPLTLNEEWEIGHAGSREERRQVMLAIYGPIREATRQSNEMRLGLHDGIARKLIDDLGSVFGASEVPSTTEPGGVGGAEPPSGLMRALPKLPARLRETEADPTVLAEDQRSSAPVSCETWLIATRTYFNGLKDGEEVSLERFANMTFWSHSRVKHLSAEHHTCCFEWKVAKVKRQVPT
jgi:hypothetical protein